MRNRVATGVIAIVACLAMRAAQAQDNAPGAGGETCVDVTIGGDRSFSCLNASLERRARAAHRSAVIAGLNAESPPTSLGLANETATRERMGGAFGHSAFVTRPPLNAGPVSPLFPTR